ncbi:glutamic acid-rich protein-like [Hibiscus syriacus]|uniref:glutamic acid-rich protein-like n=1 Tax=Hibiscus syriacus TaxID=106335 RepID=UPI001921A783|nr:glutamic acid-rich protein-like [Hibiscus syriacus]
MEKRKRDGAGTSRMERVAVLGGTLAIASLVGKDYNFFTERINLAEDGKESHIKIHCDSTNNGASDIVILEIAINDREQETIGLTGGYGDVDQSSRSETEHGAMNVLENESDDTLVMENIDILDGEVGTDVERSTVEECTLQEPSLSLSEDRSSFSAVEDDAEENPLIQSSFSTQEEDGEERHSPRPLSFSTVEEEQEDYDDDDDKEEGEEYEDEDSPMESPLSEEEEEEDGVGEEEEDGGGEDDEEEDSPMESPFSEEEEDVDGGGNDSPLQSSASTEEDEEYSPMLSRLSEEEEEDSPRQSSSFSTGEEDEEEYSRVQSFVSTEDEYSPTRSTFSEAEEEVTETEEDSSEGTWSSSPESTMERITQAK